MKRPFRGRGSRRGVRPIAGLSFNRMIPNMLTMLALCAGMTAIRFALGGRFEAAVTAIIVAAVLDGLDGRVARLLKASSTFGAELDSLSDVVCFGVAPALMLYVWTLSTLGSLGWAVALLFTVCMALRLARFNTQMGITDKPSYAYNFNTGVPAPAAAGLALLPLCASFEFGLPFAHSPYLCAATTVLTAGLMVSRLPTYSGKGFRVPADWVLPLMILVGILFAFMTTAPWPTLLGLGLAYLASIPFSLRSYAKLRTAAEAIRARPDTPHLRAVETEPVTRDAAP